MNILSGSFFSTSIFSKGIVCLLCISMLFLGACDNEEPASPPPTGGIEGLVAAYTFQGNANDTVGTANGTVSGATLVADRFGNANSAYQFDGIDDVISMGNPSSLQITSEITLVAWVNTEGTIQGLLGKGSDNESGFYVSMLALGNISWVAGVAGTNSGNTTINDNEWNFIACTYDGSAFSIYINGNAPMSETETASIQNVSEDFIIGRNERLPELFSGVIDDVLIFNRALSTSEITNLRNQSSP